MKIPELSGENVLGPYRLVRALGEGGMGTVYLAMDPSLDRQVAIKVLRQDAGGRAGKGKGAMGGMGGMAKRFMREAKSAAKLNHPHVVTIYSVGEQGSRPYIVMEYVDGGSLAERVRHMGPLYWREAAGAMRDALRGLAAAHRAGIVHRDVKPANLMRARGNHGEEIIKLVDFGLARVRAVRGMGEAAADGELTFPGAFVGSPSYSSPEQIAGVLEIDGRADVYSLAATGYALMTGQPPFVEDDPADIMERHLREAFPDVRELAPTAPAELQGVLEKASRKKPGERYQSALEMLAAVEKVLQMPGELVDQMAVVRPAARVARAGRGSSDRVPRARESVVELESRLALARQRSDSSTQLETLRSLFGLYAQLDRRDEAARAFREALAIHVKMRAPRGMDN